MTAQRQLLRPMSSIEREATLVGLAMPVVCVTPEQLCDMACCYSLQTVDMRELAVINRLDAKSISSVSSRYNDQSVNVLPQCAR